MNAKMLKISVVVGQARYARLLHMYEALAPFGAIDIHIIDDDKTLSDSRSSCHFIVYPALTDMPGYMRGLEEQLVGSDLILACETSSLAAFQAVRVGRKEQIPVVVVADEYRPLFYAGYPNIRAIQGDVVQHATAFLATSNLARNSLRLDGVGDDRVLTAHHCVDTNRFKPTAAGRKKFRDYVQLTEQDIVITVHESLVPATRVMEVLQAVRLCCTLQPTIAQRLRILLVGDGIQAKNLKYAAFDYGLGRQVLFLHQESEPFIHDLYAASDFIVHLKHTSPEVHEVFPLHILEATACGAIPLVSAGTVAAELLTPAKAALADDSFQALAMKIAELAMDTDARQKRSAVVAKHIVTKFSPEPIAKMLLKVLEPFLVKQDNDKKPRVDMVTEISKYEELIRRGNIGDTLVMLEESLLSHSVPQERSELMRLKGEALNRSGRLEEALQAYTESLQLNESNYQSYRALGYLSLQSHAHEEAVTFFKKALSRNPDDSSSLIGVGIVYRRLGLPDESLHWFETAMHKPDADSKAMGGFVQVCLECSNAGVALAAIDRAIDIRGEVSPLMVVKGQLLIKVGRSAEGHELLQKCFSGGGSSVA